MHVHRTESEHWLSNAYLLDDEAGTAVLVDGNGVFKPLRDTIRQEGLTVAAILLTHHHIDHVVLDPYEGIDAPILAHPLVAEHVPDIRVDQALADGDVLTYGGLTIEVLATPGHCDSHLAFLVNGTDVLTADVLFKGTVGGTRAPQATGIEDLRTSLRRLLALPGETVVHPGHREPTTIAEELASNAFATALLGDPPDGEPCLVGGEPATLLLWGPDYDGTNKAWVRMADGTEHMTGGSQVTRGV